MAVNPLAPQNKVGLFVKLFLGGNSTTATTQYAGANLSSVTLKFTPKFVDAADMDTEGPRKVLVGYDWELSAEKGVVTADFAAAHADGVGYCWAQIYQPGTKATPQGSLLAEGLVGLGELSIKLQRGELVTESLTLPGAGDITWGTL